MWYYNDFTGNFSIDELPKNDNGEVIGGWREIPTRPEPFEDFIFDGVNWIQKQVAPKTREQLKAERDAAVAAIVITTSTGKSFNGDETSQTRMARAIVGMQAAGVTTIRWVLANNTDTEVTLAEFSEALVLAGQAQAAIWVIPE